MGVAARNVKIVDRPIARLSGSFPRFIPCLMLLSVASVFRSDMHSICGLHARRHPCGQVYVPQSDSALSILFWERKHGKKSQSWCQTQIVCLFQILRFDLAKFFLILKFQKKKHQHDVLRKTKDRHSPYPASTKITPGANLRNESNRLATLDAAIAQY